MAVNYCGHHIAGRLGRAAPVYHKMEGATLHTGACKQRLQYDRRPDGRFGVWIGTWKLRSQSAKREVYKEL